MSIDPSAALHYKCISKAVSLQLNTDNCATVIVALIHILMFFIQHNIGTSILCDKECRNKATKLLF